jgi:recombination protein RecR
VKEFAKLPGIGKKTTLRLVLHLLKQDSAEVQHFGDTIFRMRKDIKFCQRCSNISDADICSICANSWRNQQVICVVENIRELLIIPEQEIG